MNTNDKIKKLYTEIKLRYKRIPDNLLLNIKKENLKISELIEKEIKRRLDNDEHNTHS